MTTATAKKASKAALRMRETLAKIADKGEPLAPPVIQEVKAHQEESTPTRIGRRRHFPEGVPFERIGVKVPAHLKDEMIVAMRTTHREYPTMDLFVSEAIRFFLKARG